MGAVITVMNMKGGVGKTTVSLHLAGMLARIKHANKFRSVLAIDYDPQFNLSQTLLQPKKYFALEAAKKTVLSVLIDADVDLDPYTLQVPGNHVPPAVAEIATQIWAPTVHRAAVDLVPSTLDLMYVALGQSNVKLQPMEERFAKFITEARGLYDIVLIDCHPAGSLFTKTSLRNSDHVVIPVVDERYAARGIGLMMKFMGAKKVGMQGPKPHILFNRASRTAVSALETQIRADPNLAGHCMKTTMKKYSAFSDPVDGQGFVWTSSKPYSTEAFLNARAVVIELIDRTGI